MLFSKSRPQAVKTCKANLSSTSYLSHYLCLELCEPLAEGTSWVQLEKLCWAAHRCKPLLHVFNDAWFLHGPCKISHCSKMHQTDRERPVNAQCSISTSVAHGGHVLRVSVAAPCLHHPLSYSSCLSCFVFVNLKKFLHQKHRVTFARSVHFLWAKTASPASNGLQ